MYLIVGANGFVGSYAIKNILEGTDEKILATDMNLEGTADTERITWKRCDITVHDDLVQLNEVCKEQEPLKVIYLAAYHKPDLAVSYTHLTLPTNREV